MPTSIISISILIRNTISIFITTISIGIRRQRAPNYSGIHHSLLPVRVTIPSPLPSTPILVMRFGPFLMLVGGSGGKTAAGRTPPLVSLFLG